MTLTQSEFLAALAILAALQVADILTTLKFLSLGVKEANPLLVKCFEKVGVLPTLIPLKTVLIVACYFAHPLVTMTAIPLYAVVVHHNLSAIKRARNAQQS